MKKSWKVLQISFPILAARINEQRESQLLVRYNRDLEK